MTVKRIHFFTKAVLLILALSNYAVGQVAKPADSSFVYAARNQATALYEQTVKKQAHVYEGNQYINHDPRIKVHPYYRVDSLQIGTVIYKGVAYRDVAMLYDIVRDELVVQPPEGGYRLRLITDKISAFTLGRSQFARLIGDSLAGIRTGFYELIYDGKTKVLAKRAKTIHEDISSGTYKGDYVQGDRYLIQKEKSVYEIKTKRSLLNLFPDQTKELRKYIRASRLKFKDDQRENTITRITQRYDELMR